MPGVGSGYFLTPLSVFTTEAVFLNTDYETPCDVICSVFTQMPAINALLYPILVFSIPV